MATSLGSVARSRTSPYIYYGSPSGGVASTGYSGYSGSSSVAPATDPIGHAIEEVAKEFAAQSAANAIGRAAYELTGSVPAAGALGAFGKEAIASGMSGRTPDWGGMALNAVGKVAGSFLGSTMGPYGALVGSYLGPKALNYVANKMGFSLGRNTAGLATTDTGKGGWGVGGGYGSHGEGRGGMSGSGATSETDTSSAGSNDEQGGGPGW